MTPSTAKDLLRQEIEELEPPLNTVQERADGKIAISSPQAIGLMKMRRTQRLSIAAVDPTLIAEEE